MKFLRTALASALLGALTVPGLALAQSATAAQSPASAASAPAREAMRQEVGKPLLAAQDAIRAGNHKEALARIAEAEAIAGRLPIETYYIERLRGVAASGAGDEVLAAKSFEAVLATGRLNPAERVQMLEAVTGAHFRAKNYAAAAEAAGRYLAEGGTSTQVVGLQANAWYLGGDYANAVQAIQKRLQATEAAGKEPDETSLRMLGASYNKLNDEAGYQGVLEKLLVHYPRKDLWLDAVGRVQRKPGFSQRLLLDTYRLLQAAGALETESQYVQLAELAQVAGLPIEAKRVVDEGYSNRKLGSGPDAARHAQLRDKLAKQAADDEKALAGPVNPRTPDAMVASGEALVSFGRLPRGIELLEQAIARGGLKNPDEARLRLAQAQLLAGQKAKAQDGLKALAGAGAGVGDVARLWSILAAQY